MAARSTGASGPGSGVARRACPACPAQRRVPSGSRVSRPAVPGEGPERLPRAAPLGSGSRLGLGCASLRVPEWGRVSPSVPEPMQAVLGRGLSASSPGGPARSGRAARAGRSRRNSGPNPVFAFGARCQERTAMLPLPSAEGSQSRGSSAE